MDTAAEALEGGADVFAFEGGEVAQVIDFVVLADRRVPTRDHSLVHFLEARKRALAHGQGARVPEMRIGGEKHSGHSSSFFLRGDERPICCNLRRIPSPRLVNSPASRLTAAENIQTAAAPMIAAPIQPRTIERAACGVIAHHRLLRSQDDDHRHHRSRHHSVDHRAPEQRLHRTDRRILDGEAGEHADRDDAVEPARVRRFRSRPHFQPIASHSA